MDELIQKYGYLAIVLGASLEGETVVLLGGFAAHQGYLNVLATIGAAFTGTVIGDQFFFYLGRVKGRDYLRRRPRWQAKIDRVSGFIDRHENRLMIGYRFMYGFRTLTPFALGLANVSRAKFLTYNLASAGIWATTIVGAGYLFGQLLTRWLGELKRHEPMIMLGILGIAAAIWAAHLGVAHYRKPAG